MLRIVFVIREDQMAPLHRYIPILPGGLRTRYRLELLGREAALEAVTKPAEQAGRRFAGGGAGGPRCDLRAVRKDTSPGQSLSGGRGVGHPGQPEVGCLRPWVGPAPHPVASTR